MTKHRDTLLLAAFLLCAGVFVLVQLACQPRAPVPVGEYAATATQEDWYTDNEDVPPGDWDAEYIYSVGSGAITRNATYAQGGTYSYLHYSDCTAGECVSATYITCTVPIVTGVLDAWALFDEEVGHAGSDSYHIFSAGELQESPWGNQEGWTLEWDTYEKRATLTCQTCSPGANWPLGTILKDTWHHFYVEWYLPSGTAVGTIKAWMDDVLWVDEAGLATTAGLDLDAVIAGVVGWHYMWGDEVGVYIDSVGIYGCDEPIVTPTPEVSDCNQYGHAAVLNVDDNCAAVIRLNLVPNYVPNDAEVVRATLHLYGVALEQVGSVIYVSPLVPLWGEMTTDWCRKLISSDWVLPGATAIPEDRFPGKVAEFTAASGWVEVDIPIYLIEEWSQTMGANPGLILYNEGLTGKFSIASREWVDPTYRPYITVYYTD